MKRMVLTSILSLPYRLSNNLFLLFRASRRHLLFAGHFCMISRLWVAGLTSSLVLKAKSFAEGTPGDAEFLKQRPMTPRARP